LVNPSDSAFGIAVITPRWLYVLAAATPPEFGDPIIHDETLEPMEESSVQPGDVVGIGIHTGNALRGYRLGQTLRARGAFVVFGGIHATLYPQEPFDQGAADCVVQGDGDIIWEQVLNDYRAGDVRPVYDAGRAPAASFRSARWDLLPDNKYMWGSVQTVRGCPKHCSFCSVWRTDGQKPRQRSSDAVIEEVVALRRKGFRFIALADDNFYPVALADIRNAERQGNRQRVAELEAIRAERFDLMERLAQLPADMTFFTQITMEAAEDPAFLDAMRRARIRGALVGVESVTPEGLKSVFKDFNDSGENLVERLKVFEKHKVYVLASFIFGLPTDRADTFDATLDLAERAGATFAQFVMLTPFAGTVDFEKWVKAQPEPVREVGGVPITKYWLIPASDRPKMFVEHPTMTTLEIQQRTQVVWDRFYSFSSIWRRSRVTPSLRSRLAFVFVSKLYRQMYAGTGIASDSARRGNAAFWARMLAKPTLKLFQGSPMPDLQVPARAEQPELVTLSRAV
jgi:radical SAM superfamily enzyme YgiQ (UPF0313 family)